MWPAAYFAPRYWNARYWTKTGQDSIVTLEGTVIVFERQALLAVFQSAEVREILERH